MSTVPISNPTSTRHIPCKTTSTVIMRDHDDEHDQGLQIMIYEIMILNGARRHAGVIGVIMNVTVLIMIDHAMIWISIL